jgi:hypothetical protein
MARTQTSSSQVDSELGEVCEALALLALIRAGVEEPERGAIVFAGPAGMVLELVDGALVAAAADLAVALRDGLRGTPWGECEARLEVAAAWITTTLECHAIETYCFDCSADPVHAW